jgi:UDP:flavonoid glycosyltransferase YjiC (YdhE family)
VGVVQHDGLEFDIETTRQRWTDFAACFEARAEAEARILMDYKVDVLVGDIPPLAFAAAAVARVPSVALGNFTWDWIYDAWPGFEATITRIRHAYSKAEKLLRLPLHATSPEAFAAFEAVEDVPLIARRATQGRNAVRQAIGVDDDAPLVLLSFGGFTATGLKFAELGRWSRYRFLVTPPLASSAVEVPGNVRVLNESPADYVSLLAACDVVITKPGYGIVADCLANRVSVLFTDRGPFREYDVLADCLPKLGRAAHIPRSELLEGRVGPYLDALLESATPWTDQAMDGAEVVARHVLSGAAIEHNL